MKKSLFLMVTLLFAGLVGTTFGQTKNIIYEDTYGWYGCYNETTPWFEYNISEPDSAYTVCLNANQQCEAIQFNFIPANSQYAFFFKDYSDTTSTNIPDWMTDQNFKIYADIVMQTEPKAREVPFQINIRWQGQNYSPFKGGNPLVLGDTTTVYFYNFKSIETNEWLPNPHTNGFNHLDTLLIYTQDTDYEKVVVNCTQIRWKAQKDSLVIDNMGNDSTATFINLPNQKSPNFFILSQNYPNPFNPSTNIQFSITKGDLVNLTVYNILGQTVTNLVNEKLPVGSYNYAFDGRDLPSGTYFYKFTTGSGFSQVKKMILLK